MSFKKNKTTYIILVLFLIVIFALYFCSQNNALVDWDEVTYAQVAKEVNLSKSLTYGGMNWFHKPPLYFWLSAGAIKLFGFNELSVRLVTFLSGILLSFTIYLFSKKLFNQTTASISLILILANSLLLFSFYFATTDLLALALTTLSLYFLWLSLDNKKYLIHGFICLGLSIVTKGPVAATIPLIFVLFLIYKRELANFLRDRYLWIGLAILLLISLPWHLYMTRTYGDAFYSQYFVYQIYERSKTALEGNTGSWLYYPKLIIRTCPFFLILALLSLAKIDQIKKYKNSLIFLTVWFFIQFITISKVATKVDQYILPALVPLLIFSSYGFTCLYDSKKLLRGVSLTILFSSVVFALLFPYWRWTLRAEHAEIKECLLRYKNSQAPQYLIGNSEKWFAPFYLGTTNIRKIENSEKAEGMILYIKPTKMDIKPENVVFEKSSCIIMESI